MTDIEPPGATWRRVSPKYLVVDLVSTFVTGAVLTVLSALPLILGHWVYGWIPPVVVGIVALIVLVLTPRRVRAIGYELREDDLLFRRGIMFRRIVAVPYGRMQLVDINRGPLSRALGLSELKFVTAAASSGVVIPGLPQEDAERLRDDLVARAESRRVGL